MNPYDITHYLQFNISSYMNIYLNVPPLTQAILFNKIAPEKIRVIISLNKSEHSCLYSNVSQIFTFKSLILNGTCQFRKIKDSWYWSYISFAWFVYAFLFFSVWFLSWSRNLNSKCILDPLKKKHGKQLSGQVHELLLQRIWFDFKDNYQLFSSTCNFCYRIICSLQLLVTLVLYLHVQLKMSI